MTTVQEVPDATGNGRGKEPSPYTEKWVTHVRPEYGFRLKMQATLLGLSPAALLDEILAGRHALMTGQQIADATLQRGSRERSNGDGTH